MFLVRTALTDVRRSLVTTSDYIVIGAGLAGTATAWHLANRGKQVTMLERAEPGNTEGSSHGSARIFRYAYPDRFYTDLVRRSRIGWDELERRSGRQLIQPTGALDHGELRNPTHLAGILEESGVEHELLSAESARERWPQFHFDTEVLWHPGAGVLDPAEAVHTMLTLAQATGNVDLRNQWEVSDVVRTADGNFTVRSQSGATVSGHGVIVAAGGWLPYILKSLALPTGFLANFPQQIVRQEQAFHMPWREVDKDGNLYPDWPTYIHKREGLQTYGLPGGRDANFRGQKMAEFNGGRILQSAREQDGRIDPGMRQKMIEYAEEFLPGVHPEPYAETTCLFTNTANEDFVLDSADGVTVVSACSGHGGKFAPLLGELAADLATGKGSSLAPFTVASHAKGVSQ